MADRMADYGKAIDALFKGLVGAEGLLAAGCGDGLGVGLSNRVKERLIERHGAAAEFIVFNTGYYRCGPDEPFRVAPAAPSLVKPTILAHLRAIVGMSRKVDMAETSRPTWQWLVQDRKAALQIGKGGREKASEQRTGHLH